MAKKNETVAADPPAPPEVQGEESPPRVEDGDELHLEQHSVVLVQSGDRAVEEQVIRINRAFRAQGFDALVLVVPDDTKVELLDGQQMNGAGWYRNDSE